MLFFICPSYQCLIFKRIIEICELSFTASSGVCPKRNRSFAWVCSLYAEAGSNGSLMPGFTSQLAKLHMSDLNCSNSCECSSCKPWRQESFPWAVAWHSMHTQHIAISIRFSWNENQYSFWTPCINRHIPAHFMRSSIYAFFSIHFLSQQSNWKDISLTHEHSEKYKNSFHDLYASGSLKGNYCTHIYIVCKGDDPQITDWLSYNSKHIMSESNKFGR